MITFGLLLAIATYATCPGANALERGDGRIVGGVPIPLSDAPYQVSLLFRGSHICGGEETIFKFKLCSRYQT
jgi:hypothetical protein